MLEHLFCGKIGISRRSKLSKFLARFSVKIIPESRQSYSCASITRAKTGGFPFKPQGEGKGTSNEKRS
jgi:hypothetical protein